jgi:nucleotide-binding universal stress UspA family protein
MRTILVPLDGSTLAESALPLAATIARRRHASILLAAAHRSDLPVRGGQGALVFDQRWDEEARTALRSALEKARQTIAGRWPDVRTEIMVVDGEPAESLVRLAERAAPILTVMTSHGRGGLSRLWLGSVTDALVRQLPIPVLVVHPKDLEASPTLDEGLRRVLVPVDGTPGSEGAIDAAVEVLGNEGIEFVLLRVATPLHAALRAIYPEREQERDASEQRETAERELREIEERLRQRGLSVCDAIRTDADPARAIIAAAEELDADIVSIATHGRGEVGRLLLGSVADKVLRGARVPVLVHRLTDGERATNTSTSTITVEPTAEEAVVPPLYRPPNLDRVLVGLDFAEPSQRAAAWTARHFAPGAELVLVHAVSVPAPPAFLGESLPAREQLVENARRGADIRMRELTLELRASRVWPEIRVGEPADLVGTMARAYSADMIVVGEHGARSGLASLLGTTAQRIVNEAVAPVLVARGLPDAPPRRLLAALGADGDLDRVLEWVTFLAQRFGASVVLLHAVDPLYSGALATGASETERAHAFEHIHDSTKRWLERHAERCRATVRNVTVEVAFGDPADEILAATHRTGADLVMIGHGGTGRLARVVAGGVSQRVMRRGDRPLLVIPTPPSA